MCETKCTDDAGEVVLFWPLQWGEHPFLQKDFSEEEGGLGFLEAGKQESPAEVGWMPLFLRRRGLCGHGSALRRSRVGSSLTTASFWGHRAQEGFSMVSGLGRAKKTAGSSSGTVSPWVGIQGVTEVKVTCQRPRQER